MVIFSVSLIFASFQLFAIHLDGAIPFTILSISIWMVYLNIFERFLGRIPIFILWIGFDNDIYLDTLERPMTKLVFIPREFIMNSYDDSF